MLKKIDSYIHFAVKANKILWGLDMVKSSNKKPFLIIYDEKLGINSTKQLLNYVKENNINAIKVEADYLNNLLHRQNVKIIGILDISLSNAIMNNIQDLEEQI